MKISWTPPEPRTGLKGSWDKFIGPGATSTEQWLLLIPSLIAGLAAPAYAIYHGLGWSALQLIMVSLFAFDIVGGVVTNAAAPAKRWYHREGITFRDHFQFVAIHFIHPLVISWLFLGMDWGYVALIYGYLLVAAVFILKAPLYLQRPLAFTLYMGALIIAFYAVPMIPGLEWFLPFFYLKLLVVHLVKEAPFQPE